MSPLQLACPQIAVFKIPQDIMLDSCETSTKALILWGRTAVRMKQGQLWSSCCVWPEKLTFQQTQRLGEDSWTETQTSSPHIHTTQKGRRNCIRMGRCAPSQLMELGCRSCCGTPLLGCIRRCVFSALKWQLYKLLQSTGSHQGIVLKQSWYLHLFVSPHTNAQEFLGFLNCSTAGNHYNFW